VTNIMQRFDHFCFNGYAQNCMNMQICEQVDISVLSSYFSNVQYILYKLVKGDSKYTNIQQ